MLRELDQTNYLSAVDGGEYDGELGLEMHWDWLTKLGPVCASGEMDGAYLKHTLTTAQLGPEEED